MTLDLGALPKIELTLKAYYSPATMSFYFKSTSFFLSALYLRFIKT